MSFGNRAGWASGVALLLFASSSTPSLAQVPSMADQPQREAQCLLEHSRKTNSPAARRAIAQACNFVSLSTSSLNMHKQERAYNECLLSNLGGIEDDENARDVIRSCRTLAWP
jgi:hypothetical protein